MGLLDSLVRGGPVLGSAFPALDPNDERLWSSGGVGVGGGSTSLTATGMTVTPDLAFSTSCVFAGTRLIADPMGRFKPILYRRLGPTDEAGKARARDHRLWPLLMRSANPSMTASRFRVLMTARAVLWGDAYAEIRPTAERAIGELHPLDPDTVTPEPLESGRMRYQVRDAPGRPARTLVQEEVFHLPGFGIHRFLGANLLYYARQAVGLWLAQERFNAVYFRQGAKPSLWMKVPGKLTDAAYERLRARVDERHQGVDRMHKILLAEEGAEFHAFGHTARESQLVEVRESQVHDIARWMNIPVHLLRATQQPTFASAEMFNREYYDITLAPWFNTWETEIGAQLIDDEADDLFAEFLLDALLRANTLERAQAQRAYVDGGIFSVNEVRAQENKNALDGAEYEKPHRAENIGGGGDPATTPPRPPGRRAPAPPDDDDDDGREDDRARRGQRAAVSRRARLIAEQAAARLVRIEADRVTKQAARRAADAGAWGVWLADFYGGEYAARVAEDLQIEAALIARYCAQHRQALAARGVAALTEWQETAAAHLAALALEET